MVRPHNHLITLENTRLYFPTHLLYGNHQKYDWSEWKRWINILSQSWIFSRLNCNINCRAAFYEQTTKSLKISKRGANSYHDMSVKNWFVNPSGHVISAHYKSDYWHWCVPLIQVKFVCVCVNDKTFNSWMKIDCLKFKMKSSILNSRVYNIHFKVEDERPYSEQTHDVCVKIDSTIC